MRAHFNAFEESVQIRHARLSFFVVRNMVQTRTILALYSTAGANLVKKFNDFSETETLPNFARKYQEERQSFRPEKLTSF